MEDFLLLEDGYSSEEKLIRETTARFVTTDVLPVISDAFETGHFPKHFIKKVAELGLLGMTLPEQYGGSNASYVSYGLVCQELEKGDSGLRSFVSVQSSLCMYPIFQYGSEAQRQQYLPAMARGELIGCFGLTEPDTGSDPSNMKTRATKVEGGWKLQGAKTWITNAGIADLAVVWAKTPNGIRGFIVPKDTKGFSRRSFTHKMSLRASDTGELVFDDCIVPDDCYLPGSEKGLGAPLGCLTQARYGISWGAMGAAMACYERVVNYSKERHQFEKPIGSFQLIQQQLANMLVEIVKAQAFNLQLGRLKDKGLATHLMVSMGKLNACREALSIARNARNILGANGVSLEYDVIRHMLNLESVFTYEGTDNIHTLALGRHITGFSAFS